MRILEAFGRGRPVISFEFFPPKTEKGFDSLYRAVAELKRLDPGFVSVTWGAGGSTRSQTVDLVTRIQDEIGITAMAHLTCVGATQADLHAVLERLAAAGIENVLALGGDPPKDQPDYRPPAGGFTYADELVRFVRSRFAFCLGGACYPETHPRAPSPETDLANLVRKVESGVDFLVTQLFFDNDAYFDFVERARAAGIDVPIIPGIMPIGGYEQIKRFTSLCGASIPEPLMEQLDARQDDPDAIADLGVAYATLQCTDLLTRGAPGIHFYTLNKSPATSAILSALKAARPWERSMASLELE